MFLVCTSTSQSLITDITSLSCHFITLIRPDSQLYCLSSLLVYFFSLRALEGHFNLSIHLIYSPVGAKSADDESLVSVGLFESKRQSKKQSVNKNAASAIFAPFHEYNFHHEHRLKKCIVA